MAKNQLLSYRFLVFSILTWHIYIYIFKISAIHSEWHCDNGWLTWISKFPLFIFVRYFVWALQTEPGKLIWLIRDVRNGIDYATGTYYLIVDTKWRRYRTYTIETQTLFVPNLNRCVRLCIFMRSNWRAWSRSAIRPYNNLKTNFLYLPSRLYYIHIYICIAIL